MRDYQKELDGLRQRIAQRREDIRLLEQLCQQEKYWMQEGAARMVQWNKEQRDVERLERVSLSSVWATLKGSKEDDIDREKAEEWAARLKWQEAQRLLEEIQLEIRERKERIQADADCEARYEKVLVAKEQEYRGKDPAFAAKLTELERRELPLAERRKELQEALDAGERALSQIDAALDKLDDAEGWSAWDMMGGGIIADALKYSSMDEAQRLMENMRSDLRRYQAELADVAQMAEFDLQQDSFTWAFDVVFDSFFADWAVNDRIWGAMEQLRKVESQIQDIQSGLRCDLENTEQELDRLWAERDELVRKA